MKLLMENLLLTCEFSIKWEEKLDIVRLTYFLLCLLFRAFKMLFRFLEAAKGLGVETSECLVIEDSP